MKRSSIVLYARSQDEEHWHYDDEIECAQDAYDSEMMSMPECGLIRIYQGTVSHFEAHDIITRQAVLNLVQEACDNHDHDQMMDALEKAPPELFGSLTDAIATAFEAWCAALPTEMNPLRCGVMVDIKPRYVQRFVIGRGDKQ